MSDVWEWHEVRSWGDGKPVKVLGRCLHGRVVPVESVVDPAVTVARLCLTCDAQLPAEWGVFDDE